MIYQVFSSDNGEYVYFSPVDDKKSMNKMFVLIADIISSELGKL